MTAPVPARQFRGALPRPPAGLFRFGLAQPDSMRVAVAAVLLLTLLMLLASPSGYRGGGLDDFHYLEAARCAAEHGACAPRTHWAARMPLVLPMGASLAAVGESRAAVALAPLLYACAALALLMRLVAVRAGPRAAALVGIALLATPAFGGSLLGPNIDVPEFAFLLGALAALQQALRARSHARSWSLAGGAALALAVQSRPSALCALPLLIAFMAWHPPARRLVPLFLVGLAAPLAAEALAYAAATGEPFLPWRLALGHGRIPSTELSAAVDTSRSPILNRDFIAGWNPAAGIRAHWTVSGIVNIVGHPAIGPTLLAAFALTLVTRGRGVPDPLPRILAGAGAIYFAGLVYILAVHPQPRMFLPLAAAAAALIGIACDRMWARGGAALPALTLTALAAMGLTFVSGARDLRLSDRLAAEWIASEGPATADPTTARALALVPGFAPAPTGTPLRLSLGDRSCAAARRAHGLGPDWRLARDARIPSALEQLLGRAPAPGGLTLCLWRRDRAEAPRS